MMWKSLFRIFSLQTLLFTLLLWMPLSLLLCEVTSISLPMINMVTFIIVIIGCLGVAIATIANDPIKLWFPMPWFLLTSAIYYGFGPLLYYFGSHETIAYVDEYYPVTDFSLYRTNLLTLGGIVGVIAIYKLLTKAFPVSASLKADKSKKRDVYNWHSLWKIALVFIIVGVPVKILLVLQRTLGIWDVVLPGVMEYLSVLSTLALVPLFLLWSKSRIKYHMAFLVLLCFELSAAFFAT